MFLAARAHCHGQDHAQPGWPEGFHPENLPPRIWARVALSNRTSICKEPTGHLTCETRKKSGYPAEVLPATISYRQRVNSPAISCFWYFCSHLSGCGLHASMEVGRHLALLGRDEVHADKRDSELDVLDVCARCITRWLTAHRFGTRGHAAPDSLVTLRRSSLRLTRSESRSVAESGPPGYLV
jgi:hypothetical protein